MIANLQSMAQSVRHRKVFRKTQPVQQARLWSLPLEEELPSDELCRHLKAVVCQLDLRPIYDLYTDRGGYAYPPHLMLGMLLLGLLLKVRSSRDLQDRCCYDLRFRYMMEGLQPDDRTICRFRRRLAPILPHLFQQILHQGQTMGLLSGRVMMLDGTKVEGNVSQWLREMESSDPSDRDEDDPENASDRDPQSPPSGGKAPPSGRVETDAKRMKESRGRFLRGFNVQVVCDADSGWVIAGQATTDPTDCRLLPPMVSHIRTNFGAHPEALVADRGYDSSANAFLLEQVGVQSFLHPRDRSFPFWSANAAKGEGWEGVSIACEGGFQWLSKREGLRTLHALQIRHDNEGLGEPGERFFLCLSPPTT